MTTVGSAAAQDAPPSEQAARRRSNHVLVRNVGLNAIGWAVPVVLALTAIPILVRTLGAARFGVLTLAWTLVGYLGLFDLGLGRALTQLVAGRAGSEDRHELPALTWSAVWLLVPLGTCAMLALIVAAPWLVRSLLSVPKALEEESILAFRLLALALPFTVASAALRGVLEGLQDFRRVVALRLPLALVTFVGPILVVPLRPTLPAAVGVLALGRAVLLWAHLRAAQRALPELRPVRPPRAGDVRPLLSAGGWMTVSNVVSPLLNSFDRFVVGTVLSVSAVAYYATAYEAITRLWILTAVLLPVLFPALALAVQRDRAHAAQLFDQGARAILLVTFVPALLLSAFAPEWLRWWLGADMSRHAAVLAQVLAASVLVNVTGQVAYTLIQASGRSDLTGRFHLAELLPYALVLWGLLHVAGTVGVAIAWGVRVAADTLLLALAARRVLPEAARSVRRAGLLTALGAPLVLLPAFVPSLVARAVYAAVVLAAFAAVAMPRLFSPTERRALRALVRDRLRTPRAAQDVA